MLAKLKATFQSKVIRPLLVFFRMHSATLPFIKDTTPFSIAMYHACFERDLSDLETYRVVEVRRYKTINSLAQHERIIAKVTTAESGVYGYIRFERTRGSTQTVAAFFSENLTDKLQSVRLALIQDGLQQVSDPPEHNNDFTLKSEPTSKRSSNGIMLSSFSSSSDSFKADAQDMVAQVDGFPTNSIKKENILVEMLNPRQELLLSDLVVLAHTIHTENPIYSIFKEQCYWFANMIMSVLRCEYGHNGAAVDPVAMDEHIDEVSLEAGGKWHCIRVNKTTESILRIITSQFRTNLGAFKEQVSNANFGKCNC